MRETATCLSRVGWAVRTSNEPGSTFPYLNSLNATRDSQSVEVDFFRLHADAQNEAQVDQSPLMDAEAFAAGNAQIAFREKPTGSERNAVRNCLTEAKLQSTLASHPAPPASLDAAGMSWSPDGNALAIFRASYPSKLDPKTGMPTLPVTRLTVLRRSGAGTSLDVPIDQGNGDEIQLTWSPDNNRLAYVFTPTNASGQATGSSYVMVLNLSSGTTQRAVVSPAGASMSDLAWSPDGDELLFSFFNTQASSIWRVDLTNPHSHPELVRDNASSPSWSPDGTQIAYIEAGGVGVMRSDGSGSEIVLGCCAGRVAWSPLDDRLLIEGSPSMAGGGGLYTARADGTDLTSLLKEANGQLFAMAQWAPDGSRVAFNNGTAKGWRLLDPATGQALRFPPSGFFGGPRPRLRYEYCSSSADRDCTDYVTPDVASSYISSLADNTTLAKGVCAATKVEEMFMTMKDWNDNLQLWAKWQGAPGFSATGEVAKSTGEGLLVGWTLSLGDWIGKTLSGATPACDTIEREVSAAATLAHATNAVYASDGRFRSVKYRAWWTAVRRTIAVPLLHPNLCRWQVEVNDVQVMDVKYPAGGRHCP